MTWLVTKASALVVLGFAALTIFFLIPAQTEEGFGMFLQPATMPTAAAVLLGIGAVVSLLEKNAAQLPTNVALPRVFLILGVFAAGLFALRYIPFEWTAPVLALLVMLIAGERRPIWLAVGVLIVPAVLWGVFEGLLERPLP